MICDPSAYDKCASGYWTSDLDAPSSQGFGHSDKGCDNTHDVDKKDDRKRHGQSDSREGQKRYQDITVPPEIIAPTIRQGSYGPATARQAYLIGIPTSKKTSNISLRSSSSKSAIHIAPDTRKSAAHVARHAAWEPSIKVFIASRLGGAKALITGGNTSYPVAEHDCS